MNAAFRQLRARLARTTLTVAGIAIGIIALVVVGSLAERLQTIVANSAEINRGAIFAIARGTDFGRGDLRARVERATTEIRRLPGVRSVIPEVIVPYRIGSEGARFGPPALIIGIPPAARGFAGAAVRVSQGRELSSSDDRSVVVGNDFAAAERVTVGNVLSLYGNSFTIVGVLAPSFTIFDSAVIAPYEAARPLLRQLLPAMTARYPQAPASALLVVVQPGADTALLAQRIRFLTHLEARDPQALTEGAASITRFFDAIIFGAALIALTVGALSIVNTMTVAVGERTREIGIRKAIGAGDGDVLREFLAEASAIGFLGGCVGIAVGGAIVAFIDARETASGNTALFALTPRLFIGSLLFSIILSAIAGLIPAIRAARLAPTDALRSVV